MLSINDEESLKKENITIEDSMKELNDYIQKVTTLKEKIENEITEIDKLYENVSSKLKKTD